MKKSIFFIGSIAKTEGSKVLRKILITDSLILEKKYGRFLENSFYDLWRAFLMVPTLLEEGRTEE